MHAIGQSLGKAGLWAVWAVWAGRTWARSPLRTFLLIMHALEIDTAQADAGIVGVRVPSAALASPSSQFSPESQMPSPHRGRVQSTRHTSGALALAKPLSHCSPSHVSLTPSPHGVSRCLRHHRCTLGAWAGALEMGRPRTVRRVLFDGSPVPLETRPRTRVNPQSTLASSLL